MDYAKACKGRQYWRGAYGVKGGYVFCHYMLQTGEQRKRDGGTCLSKTLKKQNIS